MFVSWWNRKYMLRRHDGPNLYSIVKIRGCVDRTIEERRFFSASKQYGEEERKIYLTNGAVKNIDLPADTEREPNARSMPVYMDH